MAITSGEHDMIARFMWDKGEEKFQNVIRCLAVSLMHS